MMRESLNQSDHSLQIDDISHQINVFDFSLERLKKWCHDQGLDPFRAIQIFQWLYHTGEKNFEHMSNISKVLREKLGINLSTHLPEFSAEQLSQDGTIKWAMALPKGGEIETVYIPEKNRGTLCISSQVGCFVGCRFCATGKQGFQRNLRVHEIIAQVWRACEKLGQWSDRSEERRAITNIVFMGMGEPLLNTRALFTALHILVDTYGFGFSKRRVTVSTSGIVPGIYQLSEEIDVALAISLHAPNDALRSALMPINERYPLHDLIPALKHFCAKSHANAGGLTVEYILLKEVNDHLDHAKELAILLKGLKVKINLIPWNKVDGIDFEPSSEATITNFAKELKAHGIFCTRRKERGADIFAACGQLIGEVKKMNDSARCAD